MNDSLLSIAELVFLLNDSLAIGGLSLLRNNCSVAISVAIFVRLSNRYARADRTDPYSHVVSECRGRHRSNQRRSENIPFHLFLPS
jgi:hypothetical protein